MSDMPPIPEFLLVRNRPPAVAKALPVRAPVRVRARKERFDLPKSLEPAGLALLKQIEREKRAKQAARLKALREKKGSGR